MQHAQFQRDAVAPELERVVHLLHHQFRVVEHFADDAVGAATEFGRARRLHPGFVNEFHRATRVGVEGTLNTDAAEELV